MAPGVRVLASFCLFVPSGSPLGLSFVWARPGVRDLLPRRPYEILIGTAWMLGWMPGCLDARMHADKSPDALMPGCPGADMDSRMPEWPHVCPDAWMDARVLG